MHGCPSGLRPSLPPQAATAVLFRKVRGGGCCAHGQSPPVSQFSGCAPSISSCSLGRKRSWSPPWPQRCELWLLATRTHLWPLGGAQSLAFVALVFGWGSVCLMEARLPCGHSPLLDPGATPEPYGSSWNQRGQQGLGTMARARVSCFLLGLSPLGWLRASSQLSGLHCHVSQMESTPVSTAGYVVGTTPNSMS